MNSHKEPAQPVAELPIQIFPRPCEGVEAFVTRLAQANHLKPAYLRFHLCDPPGYRSTLSWNRLAAATARDPRELQDLLEGTPPPSPVRLECEYCGRRPQGSTPRPPPWWCSARCRRRSDLVSRSPSSRGKIPGQRETLSCMACGADFTRPANSQRDACSPRCHARSIRTRQAELALYENPDTAGMDTAEQSSGA
ncbi:hypothetical protein AB0N07_13270 [Streptomyces sp. NPDC051172]|uniref:hypothetical protein n=1 Tax=Streptomyces sp. NPDC051172 TaxID=3155796 RepID=UPI00343C9BF6